MRRLHPCNSLGFLYVPPAEYQRAMEQQLRMRDDAMATDRNFSGEPEGFTEWSLNHVRQLAANDPTIGQQIADRIAALERQLNRMDEQHAREKEHLMAEGAAILRQISTLVDLTL